MQRPDIGFGMRHVALFVTDMAACEHFYVELLGMAVEWRPDDRNVYLSSGSDNLALHQASPEVPRAKSGQRLDHIGFMQSSSVAVDAWFLRLSDHQVPIRTAPRTHRDGARSFYCYDPDGTLVQFIHHPSIAQWEQLRSIG